MAEYDPSDHSVDEVLKKLEKASDSERSAILKAEQTGKKRVTVLEAYGINPDANIDASGRTLYPWEVTPEDHTYHVTVDEDPDAEKYRKQLQERDELIAAATASAGGDQGGSTPAGSGTPAASGTVAGGDAGAGVAAGAAATGTGTATTA